MASRHAVASLAAAAASLPLALLALARPATATEHPAAPGSSSELLGHVLAAEDACASAEATGCAFNAVQRRVETIAVSSASVSAAMVARTESSLPGTAVETVASDYGQADQASTVVGTYANPILRGSYPDPSIVRVGEEFYMASSSFEYFPGIPIHHSRDLVSWTLIGYALHRREQVQGEVNLEDVQQDGGIQAATIRYHGGKFYVVTTTVYKPKGSDDGRCINFIVEADNPAGPWSMPHVLEGADGIDPSLFFDDDGRVWYTGAHAPRHAEYIGQGEIYLQELDLASWSLKGEPSVLWHGACGGLWVEGPHLYKVDGRYYLLVAEGGTGFHHAVMVAVSDDVQGPYFSNPRNPVLTARHLSYDHWVTRVGHADLVQLADGRWFAAALGVRGDVGRSSNMGRESHLVPVEWQREPDEYNPQYLWPVLAPQTGSVERVGPMPMGGPANQVRPDAFFDGFGEPALGLEWNSRRVPALGAFSLTANPGYLRMLALPEEFSDVNRTRVSFVGVRQEETEFRFAMHMRFNPAQDGVEAGMAVVQKDDLYLKYVLSRQASGLWHIAVVLVERGSPAPVVLAEAQVFDYAGDVTLQVEGSFGGYQFTYSLGPAGKEGQRRVLGSAKNTILLYRGYTGAYLGPYITSLGRTPAPGDFADVDWAERQSVAPPRVGAP